MTKITLTKNAGGHTVGDTIEVTKGAATLLINGEYAEATTAPKKARAKTSNTPTDPTEQAEGGGDSPADPS